MLEPLARWLQVLLLRGRELLFGGGLSDPALVALPAVALSLLVGVVVVVVVVIVQGRGHAVSRALPIDEHLLLEASAASWKKPRQHEEPKKKRRKEKAKEPVNGHPPFSNGVQLLAVVETKGSQAPEKKTFKAKKKKQRLDERTKDLNVTGRRGKNEEEAETIAWNAPPDSPADSWNEATEKASAWHFAGSGDVGTVGWGSSDKPVTTSGWGAPPKDLSNSGVDWEIADSVEKDIFSNIGTWDNKAGVKSPPVIGAFPDSPETITHDNTSSQDSPARCHLSASLSSPVIDEAWLGLDDPFAVDLNSDWSPPTEEWGNWTGDKILIAQEAEQEKLKVSEEEDEKSQVNPAGSGRSKRKKRKKKGKHLEDSVESEVLRDGSQNTFLADVDLKEMSQRSGIEVEQCLTEIALSNHGASTSSSKKNGFTLDCAKTEKRKMKARRET
ncbi:uncharacterized protein LOC144593976 isoform X2 [Rhinoraja longicauda]